MKKETEHVERSEASRILKCELTQAELLTMGQELADAHSEHESITNELESIKAEFKGKIQAEEGKIGSLSAKIRAGYEHRQVKCATVKDWKSKTVTVTRLDTGAIIENRPMNQEELQMPLLPSDDQDTGVPPAPSPDDDVPDSMLEAAKEIIRETKRATASSIQRRMRVGYPTACRIIDILEARGFIGVPDSNGSREILE
jgi:DNA segregation ATPase FtsK/SpoIIIE-like protein